MKPFPFRITMSGLAALTLALSGCGKATATMAPTAGTPTVPGPTSAATVPAGRPGWQSVLTGIPLSLPARREAWLALSSEQSQTDDLRVSMLRGDATSAAYRTLGVKGEADSAPADPELAYRVLDQRLDGLKPTRGYRVQAVPARRLGATEKVWVIASTQGAELDDRQVTARTAYVGEHCDVLIDAAASATLGAKARALGLAFDGGIFKTDTRLFGRPLPVGPRGERVTIVVSPEVGNRGKDTTLGYFTARDLFSPSDKPGDGFLAHSNQGAYLYLADRVVERGQAVDSLGTLAHEFQHLISATYKVYGQAGRQEALWLNEALSMYAMAANGYGLADGSRVIASHVGQFLAAPDRYSLTHWELNPSQSGYGSGYLFATYMAERAGEDVLRALVASPQTGTANLDAQLAPKGLSFQQLYRDWVAANMLDGTGYGAPYEYQGLDLHGTYGGRQLNGVAMASVTLPDSGNVSLLPFSASYLLLHGGSGGTFTVNVAGRSTALGAFLAPR